MVKKFGASMSCRRRQRERHRNRIGVFSLANADGSRLERQALRCDDEACVKEDLIKRLLRGRGAQALTEEAAAVPVFVRRRSGSRPSGRALTDDAGTIGWKVEACQGERSRSTTVDVARSRT